MKKLNRNFIFKISSFIGVLIGILLITIGFSISFEGDSRNPFVTCFNFANQIDIDTFKIIGSLIYLPIFLICTILTIAGGFLYYFKNKNGLYKGGIIALFIDLIFIFVVQIKEGCFKVGTVILFVLSFLLLFAALILFIFLKEKKEDKEETGEQVNTETIKYKLKNNKIFILIMNLVGILSFILPFFIPILYASDGYALVFANALTSYYELIEFIGFIISLIVLIVMSLVYADSYSYFINAPKTFFKRTKTISFVGLIYNALWLIVGIICSYVNNLNNAFYSKSLSTLSYIPFIISFLIFLVLVLIDERFSPTKSDKDDNVKRHKSTMFYLIPYIFVVVITIFTFLSLFVEFIHVKYSYVTGEYESKLTGLELISNYSTLGEGFQVCALIVIVIYMVSFTLFLITTIGFIGKHKDYAYMVKLSIFGNIFLMLICSISALYFEVGTKINIDNLNSLFAGYGITLDLTNYEVKISTQTLYLFLLDLVVFTIMLLTKQLKAKSDYEENDKLLVETNISGSDLPIKEKEEENHDVIDKKDSELDYNMCPSFSQIDGKKEEFENDYLSRLNKEDNTIDLSSLCEFIVEYARNSRLHLSYTKEDIATFVSGLGASKLTILQGMSGTGKTSLPKIFTEAIGGNVEIIEVESSWRDKNELLGHFNEFTQKFTPKKFTDALYKALFNEDIVTLIVLDEMNLSRVEYYFSDFLSLMENEEDKRFIKLSNVKLDYVQNSEHHDYLKLIDGQTLKISNNIWFIGTANRDESTFVISDKVYDRAQTMNFNKRAKKVTDYFNPIDSKFITYSKLNNLLKEAVNHIDFNLEDDPKVRTVEELLRPFNISFGNRILKQMEEFIAIYSKCINKSNVYDEALETILLSKVVAKLESKTIDNKDELAEEFKKIGFNRCYDFIESLNGD